MTGAGDAAEEIVKISLEGTEMALRLTGAAAKNIAVALYAIANDQSKGSTRGKRWLRNELRSGSDVSILMLRQEDTKKFASAAKKYGLSYCVVRDEMSRDDGQVAVFVRSADAARASHIIERYGLSQVAPTAVIQNEEPDKDAFIDALGLTDEVKADNAEMVDDIPVDVVDNDEDAPSYVNPSEARTEESPSGPSSKRISSQENVIAEGVSEASDAVGTIDTERTKGRKSVRRKLTEIKAKMASEKAAGAVDRIAQQVPKMPSKTNSK